MPKLKTVFYTDITDSEKSDKRQWTLLRTTETWLIYLAIGIFVITGNPFGVTEVFNSPQMNHPLSRRFEDLKSSPAFQVAQADMSQLLSSVAGISNKQKKNKIKSMQQI